jgi:uncharacterized cupredoxin-like copper-binding protein
MKRLNALIAAALMGVSLIAAAHEGEDHSKKKAGPVKKEQKAWGIAGDAKTASRTVELVMSDNMRFTPDKVEVKQGETVKFVVKNSGKMLHEIVIGTKKELDEHAALMVKFPGMEHEEPYMAHVAAGKAGELVWTFNRPGEFDFACLIAGHYQAGMVGKINVAAAAAEAMTEGEVRKIDKENRKITLKHAEIKSLDMPPMTMVFQVSDAALLDKVQPGDKVAFTAINDNGKLTVTQIEPVR